MFQLRQKGVSILQKNATVSLRQYATFKPASSYNSMNGSCRAVGIVGLPNIGKSTLFNALTSTQLAQASNFPFCTIDPNIAKVAVPDERLDELAKVGKSEKTHRAQIEFYDIAGLVRGASKGEGLGNQFLANIREVSVILHCVRCFQDDLITHVDKTVDPLRDIDTINTELILSDLEVLEKMKQKKSKKAEFKNEVGLIERVAKMLEGGKMAAATEISEAECDIFRNFRLITAKPMMYVCNVKEGETEGNDLTNIVNTKVGANGHPCLIISAKIEEEIANMDEATRSTMTKEDLIALGASGESGLSQIIKESRRLLGVQSYYTVGPKEARAWTIPVGTKAKEAAGVIHSDMSEGFIKAEVISYKDFMELGSRGTSDIWAAAKAEGKVRVEGANYVMTDSDIVIFKFK